MNENLYKYSLLQYKHSALLNESLNIGVLIYFQNKNSFVFKYSKKLSRVKNVYSNVSDKIIKHYLKQINSKINKFNELSNDVFFKEEISSSFETFISNHLLPKDGSSLQFSKPINSFQYEKGNNDIIDYLVNLFLFEESEPISSKDYVLVKSFYSNIKRELNHIDPKYFKKDFKVKNKTGVEFNFNYAWKNGSLNLVKPLNFDLNDSKYISDKAHKNYGLVVDLQDSAEKEDFRYDFLVGRPTNKRLFKEYDHSIALLEKLPRINIIEENEIEKYSFDAIDTLLKKSSK